MSILNIKEERKKARLCVESTNFDYLIMCVICMDAIALGMLTVGLYDIDFLRTMFLLDRLCMAIFIVEMLIKMYAYGANFFKSRWNCFDLAIITISSIPATNYLIILRTFRLFRLLGYVKGFRNMKNIINIMLVIMPSFAAMMLVFGVMVYAFGVMGVVLFGEEISAFGDLGASVFSLIQCFTFDGWSSTIVRPIMRIYPHAWIYFYLFMMSSFLLVISFILSVVSLMVKREFKVKSLL